jgi:hypothetical protein
MGNSVEAAPIIQGLKPTEIATLPWAFHYFMSLHKTMIDAETLDKLARDTLIWVFTYLIQPFRKRRIVYSAFSPLRIGQARISEDLQGVASSSLGESDTLS